VTTSRTAMFAFHVERSAVLQAAAVSLCLPGRAGTLALRCGPRLPLPKPACAARGSATPVLSVRVCLWGDAFHLQRSAASRFWSRSILKTGSLVRVGVGASDATKHPGRLRAHSLRVGRFADLWVSVSTAISGLYSAGLGLLASWESRSFTCNGGACRVPAHGIGSLVSLLSACRGSRGAHQSLLRRLYSGRESCWSPWRVARRFTCNEITRSGAALGS